MKYIFLCATALIICIPSISASGNSYTISDEKLNLNITANESGVREASFTSGGISINGLEGISWSFETSDGILIPLSAKEIKAAKNGKSISLNGDIEQLSWELEYKFTGLGRITKSLVITPKRDISLKTVSMWNASSSKEPIVSRTPMQDIAAFYREGSKGIFVSLDFPYSKIQYTDSVTTVKYPPHVLLKAGERYTAHSLTFGATELTGKMRYGYDEGEVDAVDSYIQEQYKPRFNKPMLTSCCMNNRYTQIEKGYVFYTMYDHPTLSFHKDLYKRDLKLMRELGMEYYQVFPGVFDWVEGDPDPADVKELMDYSRKLGMRTGDYSTASGLFCGHYNEYGNFLNKNEWRIKDKNGSITGLFSLGVPEYVDYYINTVVPNGKKYGFEIHNLDFLDIRPDYSTDKPYPPGEDNVYHQVKGLIRLLEAINSISPNMMSWSNSGNWVDFLPKIAWYNHNLYITDPYIVSTWQGLNMTRLLDDARREQMVTLHYTHFLPYRFFSNYQYFFSQNSIVPEIRNYQYGALSTLAVTPNIGLGDIRQWLDKMPDKKVDEIKEFYNKWIKIIKKDYKLWTKTYHAADNPGMGSVEIYSHIADNKGYIFIVNPQYWDRVIEVPFDKQLGFSDNGKVELTELHPVERLKLTAQGPFVSLGTNLQIHIPAQQVMVLQVKPAPNKITKPRMYGIPGAMQVTDDGYTIRTSGPQGKTERIAILLPEDSLQIKSVSVDPNIPKQAKRLYADTPIKLISSSNQAALVEFTYRRTPAPTEIRNWNVRKGDLPDGTVKENWTRGFADGKDLRFPLFIDTNDPNIEFPMWDSVANDLKLGPLANFCGAYIDNAFSESQETVIYLHTTGSMRAENTDSEIVSSEVLPQKRPLDIEAKDASKSWWLQTKVNIPFMYWQGGNAPFFDEHTILVLPTIRQSRIKEIKAWINGIPLNIQTYFYPRNRGIACYYADLIDTGAVGGDNDNTIVVYYEVYD